MAKKTISIPGDKEIYLAFCKIFTGVNSQVRRQSAIQKLVHDNERRPEVASFLKRNNGDAVRDAVYERLKVLLEKQVFKSYQDAKLEFPDLPAVTAAQTVERAASKAEAVTKAEAAVDHTRAIEETLQDNQEAIEDTAEDSDKTCASPGVILPAHISSVSPIQKTASHLNSGLPVSPLFPSYLPFITGHKIIVKVQTVLEQACFEFAKHAMPETLESRGWDCAEAVELNIWVHVFSRQEYQCLFRPSMRDNGVDGSLYKSLCDIRHTAVHRDPVTAAGILKYLSDGEVLATLLDDGAAAGWLSAMRCKVERVTVEMENNQNMLEAELFKTQARIATERAELDRQEQEAIDGLIQANKEHQLEAGTYLEQILAADVTTARNAAVGDESAEDTEEQEGILEVKMVRKYDYLGLLPTLYHFCVYVFKVLVRSLQGGRHHIDDAVR